MDEEQKELINLPVALATDEEEPAEDAEDDESDYIEVPAISKDQKSIRLKPLEARKGKTAIVYLKLANLAIRGYSTRQIADELGLEERRVNKLLKENVQIWDYIQRHLTATFSEGDRILAYLYKKAMVSLDEELSSDFPDVRQKARDQIFNMLKLMGMSRSSNEDDEPRQDNRTVIFNQFFGGTKSPVGGKIKSMDDLILQKRQERGLETVLEASKTSELGEPTENEETAVHKAHEETAVHKAPEDRTEDEKSDEGSESDSSDAKIDDIPA